VVENVGEKNPSPFPRKTNNPRVGWVWKPESGGNDHLYEKVEIPHHPRVVQHRCKKLGGWGTPNPPMGGGKKPPGGGGGTHATWGGERGTPTPPKLSTFLGKVDFWGEQPTPTKLCHPPHPTPVPPSNPHWGGVFNNPPKPRPIVNPTPPQQNHW